MATKKPKDYPAELTRQRREADDEVLLWLLLWADKSKAWAEVSGHLSAMLRDGHGDAHAMGVQHGGKRRPSEKACEAAARSAWEGTTDREGKTPAERWQGLDEDVDNGRYGVPGDETDPARTKGLKARIVGYTTGWAATANDAWTHTEGDEVLYDWVLGQPETGHCPECPEWAEGGPYTREDLPAVPGDGTSTCQSQCHCHLETQDGRRGFRVE